MSVKVNQLMVDTEWSAAKTLEEATSGLPFPESIRVLLSKFKNEAVKVTKDKSGYIVTFSYIMTSPKSLPEAAQVAAILISEAVKNNNVIQNPKSKSMRELFDSKGISADRGIDFNEAPFVMQRCENSSCDFGERRAFSAKRKDPKCPCCNSQLTQTRVNWNYRLDSNYVNEFGVPPTYRWSQDKEHIQEIFKSVPKEAKVFLAKIWKDNGWSAEKTVEAPKATTKPAPKKTPKPAPKKRVVKRRAKTKTKKSKA